MSTSKAKSATKKLGRVMWVVIAHEGERYFKTEGEAYSEAHQLLTFTDQYKVLPTVVPRLSIDLSDPAALVEKVAQALNDYRRELIREYPIDWDEMWSDKEASKRIATRALGVPAKLLKERKKK